MQLSLVEFCEALRKVQKPNADKALALLWYHDRSTPDIAMSSGELAKLLDDHHVGSPHSTRLADALRRSRMVKESNRGLMLKPGSRKLIYDWLAPIVDQVAPPIDHSSAYLPYAVWATTRGYIESVCAQLNGCFQYQFYDAASVMLRRLIETLIIEGYEARLRPHEIRDANGEYVTLKHLIDRAIDKSPTTGLSLGRDAKKALEQIKALGDRAAHNRRFVAHANDLTSIQSGVRVTVQELIAIADLQRKR